MKTYYYYYRDNNNVPLVTACLLVTKNIVSRGIAICSPLDIPCKDTGRRLARGKALRALGTKSDSSEIVKGGGRSRVYNVLQAVNFPDIHFKSMYNPELTTFEKKILKKVLQ